MLCGFAASLTACIQVDGDPDKLSADKASECVSSGGSIEQRGMALAETCVRLFADRGKECGSGSDCEGECRFDDDTRGPPPPDGATSEAAWMHPSKTPPLGTAVVGHCQWSSDPFGCRSTVVNGKLQESLCVD